MYIGLHVNYPLFLSDFNESSTLATDFRKHIFVYQLSYKSVQWGGELFHVDGQTDRHDEANSRFLHLAKAHKKLED